MARPKCGHCGTPYGQRALDREVVRWDTPSKQSEGSYIGPNFKRETFFLADGAILPPPAYRGNGIVVSESSPHISGSDGRAFMERQIWDGESYCGGYDPFCTLRCALDYARRAFARANAKSNIRQVS